MDLINHIPSFGGQSMESLKNEPLKLHFAVVLISYCVCLFEMVCIEAIFLLAVRLFLYRPQAWIYFTAKDHGNVVNLHIKNVTDQ